MTRWTMLTAIACAGAKDDSALPTDSDTDSDTDADSDTDTDADTDVACTIFPSDNDWNRDITEYLVHDSSDDFVNTMGRNRSLQLGVGATFEDPPLGISYVSVPGSQPKVGITFLLAAESDSGPYPIPSNAPIEGGPASFGARRVIALDLDGCSLYELFEAWPIDEISWRASAGAIFDLSSNDLRPDGWRSADASGLPVYPGLVLYDEVIGQGAIKHALRLTVSDSQMGFIHPATDYASTYLDPALPPMGLRLRMKPDYDCSTLSDEVQVICAAMKTYGLLVSDEGEDWVLTGEPDSRWDRDALLDLGTITGDAFEAVYTGDIIIPQ